MAVMSSSKQTQEELVNVVIDENQGLTPLHSAAYYGKMKALRALVEVFNANIYI